MEVQDRPVLKPAALISAVARPRTRLWRAVALAATLIVAAIIVLAQPIRSPWWTYADADATYSATSLNLFLGRPVQYLDHPGLPLEQLLATAFAADYLVAKARGDVVSRQDYVDTRLLDLDLTRPYFRGLAAAFYLAGALLSFVLVSRLLGHWTWGLAAGLLWIAAPYLTYMSIMYRPDVPLTVLALVFAYLVGRAVEDRSAALYGAAAFLLGLTIMVKMHAAGLVVPLALAAVLRPPPAGWGSTLKHTALAFARERARALRALVAVWLLLAFLLNGARLPFSLTTNQKAAAVLPVLVVGGFLLVTFAAERFGLRRGPVRWFLNPFYGFLAVALLAGLAVPVTLNIPDGLESLAQIAIVLSGGGVNIGVEPFSAPLRQLIEPPLLRPFLVFLLAGVAAVFGVVRRDARPIVWFVGALVLGVMAQAREAFGHYFAPSFALSMLAMLWVFQRDRGQRASILVWPVIAYLVLPAFQQKDALRIGFDQMMEARQPTVEVVERGLRENEVALTPHYWPHADPRYFDFVQGYVNYVPEYPYRLLPASSTAAAAAVERGLSLRYYIAGEEAESVTGVQTMQIGDIGEFEVRRVDDSNVVELVSGPGVSSDSS